LQEKLRGVKNGYQSLSAKERNCSEEEDREEEKYRERKTTYQELEVEKGQNYGGKRGERGGSYREGGKKV